MTSAASDTPTWQTVELLGELEVCLICYRLTGRFADKEHRCACVPRDDEWRKREWPHSDIAALIDLCKLCARGTMKSGSRYTWLVCENCLTVNRTVGSVFGSSRTGALPVGRHSIMNNIRLGGGSSDEAAVGAFSDWLLGLSRVWTKLFEWGPEAARGLAIAAGLQQSAIPLSMWLGLFPSGLGASVDAFCRFVEYDLPDHPALRNLIDAHRRFLEEPGAQWGL